MIIRFTDGTEHRLVTRFWFSRLTVQYCDVYDTHVYTAPIRRIKEIVDEELSDSPV